MLQIIFEADVANQSSVVALDDINFSATLINICQYFLTVLW